MGEYGQLITVLGAAGALLYVLKLLVDGKLHTHSEVEGLLQDKRDLLTINAKMAEALSQTNDILRKILDILDGPDGTP